jgi:mono/diheme cytochrome c family protein
MKTSILTLVVVIILAMLGGVLFAYSGIYNVAATSRDNAVLHWLLKTTREASIERDSENITPPDQSVLTNPQTLRIGFEHYNEMCVVCHGAPGLEPGEARAGLNPKPPLLAKVADKISSREMFWVIKHGIKMTGMPAWGPTHSDDKIWAMVAFVKTLPKMSPAQYQAMQAQAGHADGHGHSHEDHAH